MKWCEHHYEEESHGIDLIKLPSGKSMAWGGLNNKDHFKYCPYCGTPRPKEKSLEEELEEELIGEMIAAYYSYERKEEHPRESFERVFKATIAFLRTKGKLNE